MSTNELCHQYTQEGLREEDVDPNPIRQFTSWFELAQAVHTDEWFMPHAMTLATCGADGIPAARVVLLKTFDDNGFVFYTNYVSQKAQQFETNPSAALVFYWPMLQRQVRITGPVTKISIQESEAYHRTRPRGSQLGALVSNQSEVIPNRDVLERKMVELDELYRDRDVPLPENWGGYRVAAHAIEFWQGRPNRLHDRLLYTRQSNSSWTIQRLAP